MKRSLKKIILAAKDTLEPDTSTMEGLKKHLMCWYVLKFKTTFKDPVLLEHSLEELLHLYYVYLINENPEAVEEIINPDIQSYEDWLRQRMGEDYVSEEDMSDNMVEYEKQEKKIAEKLPEKIETDFSMLGED